MHTIREISDSRRDVRRYHRLLLALDRATTEIGRMEREGHPDIDEVLDRLLPDLAAALNAEQAFAAKLREDGGRGKCFELTAVHPTESFGGRCFESSGLLQQLVEDGKPRVIDPLGEKSRDPIPGLEILNATSAVLVRMQTADQVRVVGVCNKAEPDIGPYLASDGIMLNSILELVAIGARVGERRRRELEAIQRTSAAISAKLDLHKLLTMIVQAVREASKAITARVVGEPKRVLECILEQAVEHITGVMGPKAMWGAAMLYDEVNNELHFENVYPPEMLPKLEAKLGNKGWSVDRHKVPGGRIGITGRAVLERKPQRVGDVRTDPDYLAFNVLTRSELDVPMLDGDRVVGVLSVESDQVGAFDVDDELALQVLAEMAVIAIHSAKQYEALREAQDELLASGAIAWMGLFGSEWSHTVAQKTYGIRNYVDVLRDIATNDNPLVKQALDSIDIIAQEIQDVPLTIPPSADTEKGEPIPIDSFVSGLLKQWCEPHEHIHLELDLCCDDVLVRADGTLLKMALRKLVDNAIQHMPKGGTLRVESLIMSKEFVAIALQDTGSGIPDEYRPFFGRRRIPRREGDSGSGMGALLARFILRKYGGNLELVWSEKGKGTRLEITLPLCE